MKKLLFIIILNSVLIAQAQNIFDHRGKIRMLYGTTMDTLTIYFDGDSVAFDANHNLYRFKGGIKPDSINLNGTWYTDMTPSQWITTGSDIYYNTGNVGINDATPDYLLDVEGLIGSQNIETNTTSKTTKLGYTAGVSENETAARYNTFIGEAAGYAVTTGNHNTSVGYLSNYYTITGVHNASLGYYAGVATTGGYNTFIGSGAGASNTGGNYNTTLGYYSGGEAIANGDNNIYLGHYAGAYETGSGVLLLDAYDRSDLATSRSSAILYGIMSATAANQILTSNSLFDAYNIETNTTSKSTRLGYQALDSEDETAARYNVAIGYDAGTALTTGGNNTLIGYNTGAALTTQSGVIAIGKGAYATATYGDNIVIGVGSGAALTAGSNVIVGSNSSPGATTAQYNTFVGNSVGFWHSEGDYNTSLGYKSSYSLSTGTSNVTIGAESAEDITSGGYNIIIGRAAGNNITEGNGNVNLGYNAGFTNTTGDYNVMLGENAGYTNASGDNIVAIGRYAGYYSTLSNRIFINSLDRSNIAGDTTKSIIYGYMDDDQTEQRLTFNAKTYVNNSLNYGEDGEASDTYVAAITGITAYQTGLIIYFKANTANTGACTININSLGAKSLKSLNDQDPPNNYIEAGSMVHAIYDGTNFQMLQPDANP